jgi:16S rRNA (guanine966-N2)-methyltransferase
MRVIAGKYKGRQLKPPNWEGLRPTSDKLRETLFNILSTRIPAARVLDGFAGTGAVGIEALSRGAAHVTFIERDPRALKLIAENVARCGIADGYTIERGDATVSLTRQATAYDVVFLDPPYDMPQLHALLSVASSHLADNGVIVLERATRTAVEAPSGLVRVRDVKSGDSSLTFFVREDRP